MRGFARCWRGLQVLDEQVSDIDVTSEIEKIAAEDENLIHIRVFTLPDPEETIVITTEGIVALGRAIAESYLRRR